MDNKSVGLNGATVNPHVLKACVDLWNTGWFDSGQIYGVFDALLDNATYATHFDTWQAIRKACNQFEHK